MAGFVATDALLDQEQIGPTLNLVYARSQQQELLSSIDHFVAQKDEEIQSLCDFHHQVAH